MLAQPALSAGRQYYTTMKKFIKAISAQWEFFHFICGGKQKFFFDFFLLIPGGEFAFGLYVQKIRLTVHTLHSFSIFFIHSFVDSGNGSNKLAEIKLSSNELAIKRERIFLLDMKSRPNIVCHRSMVLK